MPWPQDRVNYTVRASLLYFDAASTEFQQVRQCVGHCRGGCFGPASLQGCLGPAAELGEWEGLWPVTVEIMGGGGARTR